MQIQNIWILHEFSEILKHDRVCVCVFPWHNKQIQIWSVVVLQTTQQKTRACMEYMPWHPNDDSMTTHSSPQSEHLFEQI